MSKKLKHDAIFYSCYRNLINNFGAFFSYQELHKQTNAEEENKGTGERVRKSQERIE